MTDTDVLIIGAGPTGTTLALELALQKTTTFRIIDQAPTRSDKSRALIIQPRTLEVLARHGHGLARALVAAGTVGTGARVFVNKKLAAEVDLSDLGFDDTAFPLPLWISQADTERLLDEALRRAGHEVERPVVAEGIVQEEQDGASSGGGGGVSVLLRNVADGSEETVRARYVVGCDGAHSVVRHAAGLEFDGSAYPQEFLLADLHLEWLLYPDGDRRLNIFMGQGILIGFPLKDGLFRLVISTTDRNVTAGDGGEPTLEDFRKVWGDMVPGEAVLRDPVWLSRFRLHHRGASCYRAGRLFVAGDAAHIHSPVGGQGMNTGIQDAVNLGWKLAAVLRGEANEKLLLDSYDVERRRVGEHLLKGTDRAFRFVSGGNPVFIFLRNFLVPWVIPWAVSDRGRRAKAFRFMSELGIKYRRSPIVGTASNYHGPLRGGDRAPDATLQGPNGPTSMHELFTGPSHHLVVFSGPESGVADDAAINLLADSFEAHSGWAKTHNIFSQKSLGKSGYVDSEGKVRERYGFVEPGYVLIRPDGYLAHLGTLTTVKEFLDWLKTYIGP